MRHNNPKLALNFPACGERLAYDTSMSSGGGAYEPGGVFRTVADAHHYACLSFRCRRFWKFGPGSGLAEGPLRLAEGAQPAPRPCRVYDSFMTYDGRADHLLAYFRGEVLAAYQAQPDKFSVSTDHFEGRVETTGAYFEVLDAADRTDESIGVLFGYRTLASGELAVVVWGPDLFDKSAWHVQQWSAFRIDGRAVDWMPVADDTRYNLWTRRYLSGDWNVENGPGAALAEVIVLINGLTLEIVGSRLFDVGEPRISFPAAENTHRYADAHRELYGVIADGLDKATIQAIASALGRAVACASDRTLSCLRKALPALDEEAGFSTPLATMSAQRRLAAHKVRPAAQPMRAFDAFTEDLRGCVGGLEKLRTTLETAFGVDAKKCRSRQDALRHLRKFDDENLPANYGIHAARGMIGKTVESVRVGERERTAGVHRSEMIEIHFTDGSLVSLHTGSNANGIRPRAGETDVTPDDFHADFIVEWVPPRPARKPIDPAE